MGPWEKAKKRKRWEGDAGVNVEDQEDSVLSSKKEKKSRNDQLYNLGYFSVHIHLRCLLIYINFSALNYLNLYNQLDIKGTRCCTSVGNALGVRTQSSHTQSPSSRSYNSLTLKNEDP